MAKFSWSWSKLKNWRTCPRRHYHVDILKKHRDESEALTWGKEVHDAMANRITKGTALPPTMQRYEDWPARIAGLKDQGLSVRTEMKLSFDQSFQPCGYFDAGVWYRGVLDVIVPIPEAAIVIDWKTGKNVEPEAEQLGLFAQTVFAHYPDVQQVATIYVWLGHDTQTVNLYKRDQMAPFWNELLPEIKRLETANKTLDFPPKPSFICRAWCPVKECEYHGKDYR